MRYVIYVPLLMTVLSCNVHAVGETQNATATPSVTLDPAVTVPAPVRMPEIVAAPTPAPAPAPTPAPAAPAAPVSSEPFVMKFPAIPAPDGTIAPAPAPVPVVTPVKTTKSTKATKAAKATKATKAAKSTKATKPIKPIKPAIAVKPITATKPAQSDTPQADVTSEVISQPKSMLKNKSATVKPEAVSKPTKHISREKVCCTPTKREPWKFIIAPYVWGMNMSGTEQVANRVVPVHEQFNDILNDFKGGGMLLLEAQKGNFGVFGNVLYAYLNRQVPVGSITYKPVIKFGLYTLGLSYKSYAHTFSNCTNLAIEPYLGARYTQNDLTIKTLHTTSQVSKNEGWVDPIVGARFTYTMNQNWLTGFAGDLGGTDFNTQKSYNLNAYIGYVPTSKCSNVTLYAGYRLLYQHYTTGSGLNTFAWKMHLFGPVLGIAFKF